IKYCFNRPCALYAVPDPFMEEADKPSLNVSKGETAPTTKLTSELSSAFFPRFRWKVSCVYLSKECYR
ncbi:hypothetical protein L9G15_26095, partial [Shewanella sp. A3A]|nr:hypothetical protein [Shewanella ferrihydritica]